MTPSPDALKPCPFCGGKPSVERDYQTCNSRFEKYHIHCSGNDCPVYSEIWKEVYEDAAAAWNTRAGESQ